MMPPSNQSDGSGWIHSDEFVLPRQTLSAEEIGPFLEFLFSRVVRKPKQLKLKETAGVTRYLKALVLEYASNKERGGIE